MTTDYDDDLDEIVVDDKPREDGLVSADEAPAETAKMQSSAMPQLEQIATAIPQILQRLDALADQPVGPDGTVDDRMAEVFDELASRLDTLIERVGSLEERLDDCSSFTSASPIPNDEPATREDVDSSAAVDAVVSELVDAQFTPPDEERLIEQLVFGTDLCENSSIDNRRQELLDGVLARESTAIGLAARLMLVRAAGADEFPPLLKEIGEAYYRRHPKTEDAPDQLESLLVDDLDRRIAAVGLRNSIELIRPGDRYDATRHVSPDRGVEVAEVRGWAVLRDNGKPLTKANVGLR